MTEMHNYSDPQSQDWENLAWSPWQHLDATSTRVDGKNQSCHVVCNPLYTAYFTTPQQDRLSVLSVLRGLREPVYRINDEALLKVRHSTTTKYRTPRTLRETRPRAFLWGPAVTLRGPRVPHHSLTRQDRKNPIGA